MAKYSIQDTSLIAIGDAIRNKSGKHTRVEYIPKEVWIFKSPNVNSLEEALAYDINTSTTTNRGFRENVTEVITVPGAVKLVLQMVLTKYAYDTGYKLPEYSGDTIYSADVNKQLCEYEITGDTITIQTVGCEYGGGNNAFYAEVRGYDGDGNLIKDENTMVEIEVKDTLTPAQMATEIEELSVLPPEAFNVTGDCNYRFSSDGWNWFISNYGDKITTKDINRLTYTFGFSYNLSEVPFDLNITSECKEMNHLFYNCYKLKEVPRIVGTLTKPTSNYSGVLKLASMFYCCYRLKEIPYDFFSSFGGDEFWAASKTFYGTRNAIFQNCSSLRRLPDISMLISTESSIYSCLYYNICASNSVLDEITNLPVLPTAFTSNAFQYSFDYCNRVKRFTFALDEEGKPIPVAWKSQTIDLSKEFGYTNNVLAIENYSDITGITKDKRVTDAASYQALKDDPDWWTKGYQYSRYNHDSAVETINSLPDASSGSNNTIKFFGTSGELTDGGAINTLTEAEIAVAAAKGWTVSFV